MEEQRLRQCGPRSFVWPIILIAVGVIFLLSNLGVLETDIWEHIWRFWPLMLVAIGLELIVGRRSVLVSLLGVGVIVAILAGALWLAGVRPVSGESLVGQTVAQPLSGISQAIGEIVVRYGK